MPLEVLRRDDWDGRAKELGDLFVLHKGNRTARWVLTIHVLGWECTLLIGKELIQSKVCRSQDEVLTTGEEWKAAMLGKRWHA